VKHHIDHYLETLKPLGIQSQDRDMVFPLDGQIRRWAAQRLEGPNKTPIIGLAPGGARNVKESMATRRWPLENYRDLGEMLIAKGFRLAILGGREDKYVEGTLKFSSECQSFVGECSLKQTAALMSHCRAVVTHDSGPMHLAGAVGVPVFSIFGPTDPREKAPLKNSTYFWKPEVCQSAPCYKDGVFPECKDVPCMKAVTPRDIFDALMRNSEF
jgi:heptosyltransferase-2